MRAGKGAYMRGAYTWSNTSEEKWTYLQGAYTRGGGLIG